MWCPETESNRRHKDFQSFALPTELSGRTLLYEYGDPYGIRTRIATVKGWSPEPLDEGVWIVGDYIYFIYKFKVFLHFLKMIMQL